MGSVLESKPRRWCPESSANRELSWMGCGSRAEFQTVVNCSNVSDNWKRLPRCKCQSRADMRPSCQSGQRGSFSMANHYSWGVRGRPSASAALTFSTSTRTRTLPISKITARNFATLLRFLGSSDSAGSGLAAGFQIADDGRQEGKKNHHGDHVMNALADIWNGAAQGVAAQNHGTHPEDAAEDVIDEITRVRHFRRPGDWWAKRANNGHKTRKDDGAPAVFLVEIMRALQVAPPE